MAKKILFGVLVVVGLFLVYVALQPSDYIVSREVTIDAPAEKIFPYVNDPKKMDTWNAFLDLDPGIKINYSGPASGVGAKSSWEGEKLGVGSATVVESVPYQMVRSKLEFKKPNPMDQDSQISLTPVGDQTVVRWSVTGKNSFIGRIFCVFMNMDKMVGGTFEKGLSKLKTIAEM